MNRLMPGGRTVIVPIDDSLIAGPRGGLRDMDRLSQEIADGRPNAVLGFSGQLGRLEGPLRAQELVLNLSVSSTMSRHVEKRCALEVETALRMDCVAVAVHVNTTSDGEGRMLADLAEVVSRGRSAGMPVLAIMYPRSVDATGADDNYLALRESDRNRYASLVAHSVRIAADLGANIIKTHYTHDIESFSAVIDAASGVPVVVAGGPKVQRELALARAREAMLGGASGISYGRNVFDRQRPGVMIEDLKAVVHERPLGETSSA